MASCWFKTEVTCCGNDTALDDSVGGRILVTEPQESWLHLAAQRRGETKDEEVTV